MLFDCCYSRHGPDANTRKGGLRIDLEKEAFATLSSDEKAFVTGKPGSSGSVHRILSDDPESRMPPPESNLLFSAWDDFGYNVVQRPVYVHDFQATLMHLLGVDHERLTFKSQGRRYRLTDVHGEVVKEILA